MILEQIYTGCLSQGAYYIESAGEVAIIDPLREVESYLEKAQANNAIIKYIFETHFHADFVSGHVSLAERTAAPIVFGPNADPNYPALIAKDEQVFKLGNVSIVALHTPGHTMESTSYLLKDEMGKDYAIFTGDTLFLGDVGRPDLAQKKGVVSVNDLAGMLYDSLRNKIMPLSDEILVYPAHGAGSACGKNMMNITVDSLGNQKKVNYALRENMTKREFISEVTDGLSIPPPYFPHNVRLNKEGYGDVEKILANTNYGMTPDQFERTANASAALVLDVRHHEDFENGHIPRSVFIGLGGAFAPWVGELMKDVAQPILLVVDESALEEAIIRLSRVGFDKVLGYLKGGISAWKNEGKEISSITSISAPNLKRALSENPKIHIVDVRTPAEYKSERIATSQSIPLRDLNKRFSHFNTDKKVYLYCAGGYRSVIASSILKARGHHNIVNVRQGMKGIKKAGIEITDFSCGTQV